MKLEVNKVAYYVTLTTETAKDQYLMGLIAARLNKGTFSDGENRSIDINFEQLVKALAGEK